MKFSKQELICFNSILDGNPIVGINLRQSNEKDVNVYVNETMRTLKDKNILDESGRITKIGILPIEILKKYKNAKKHISFNFTKVALLDDNKVVIIKIEDDQYNISICNKVELLHKLVSMSSYMQKETMYENKIKKEKLDFMDLLKSNELYNSEAINTKVYFDGSEIENKIYYWNNEKGFLYDLNNEYREELTPRGMRMKFMDLIGISLNQEGII